jgi:PGF-CTERM protein
MKTNIKASIIGLAVALVLIGAVSAVDATAVKVVPASQTVHASETFSVNITIENVTNMKSDQAVLNFDSRAMNAMEIIEGDFLKSGGTTLPVEKINNTEGTAGFAYTLWSGTPVTGSGVLATIKFNTSGDIGGTFNLNLTEVRIKNGTAEVPVSVYNGSIKILAPSPTPTPTPSPSPTAPPAPAGGGGGGGGGAPADTDGDGLSDFDEKVVYKTDPYKADTDGGGVNDGAEIIRGTDPLDPTDDVVSTPTPSPTPQVTPTPSPAVTLLPTPTPTPPGFEAFSAIAGLLAVAYLVMRRR